MALGKSGAALGQYLDDWLAGRVEPGVTRLVGIRLVAASEREVRLEMEAGPQHHNPMGIVHGGILCDLADAAMGVAMACSLEAGETFSTLELQLNYLRPVRQGRLAASARMVRRGRTTAYLESEVLDAEGQLIAKGSSCCVIKTAGGA
jgi:uncharacterized protein (TIGR00369 family)